MRTWKDTLLEQIKNSDEKDVELTITEFSMATCAFINSVKEHKKKIVILNRGKAIAMVSPVPAQESA